DQHLTSVPTRGMTSNTGDRQATARARMRSRGAPATGTPAPRARAGDAARWLAAEAGDAVRIVPVTRPGRAPGPGPGTGTDDGDARGRSAPNAAAPFQEGLRRWRGRVARRRAIVLARRSLLVA